MELKKVEEFVISYLEDFINYNSENIVKYYDIPSSIFSKEYTCLFLNSKDIVNYYKILFTSLKSKQYQKTVVNDIKVEKISSLSKELLFIVNLEASRINKSDLVFIKLSCQYLIKFDNSLKFVFVRCKSQS